MTPTEAAVEAAAAVIVRVVYGPTAKVEHWHREMTRTALAAAEHHRAADPDPPARDPSSTLSATTDRAYPPRTYDAARRVIAGHPFGFGRADGSA